MGRRRTRVRALACAFVAALTATACGGGSSDTPRAEAGEAAPTFSTFDLEGRPVALADYRGKVVLLNFWASWCAPCREEFPRLKAVHGRDDVVVLGVVFDDSKRKAAAFMQEQGATWPGLVDPDHDIADAYGVFKKPGIPVTWAIDADGVARARHLGPLTDAALTDVISEAR